MNFLGIFKRVDNKKRKKFSTELNDLYKDLLLRKPDRRGLEHFLSLLTKDEITLDEIRDEMMDSQEYFEKIVLDKDNIPKQLLQESKKIITNLYKEIVHRKPDRRGLEQYTLLLASGNMTEKEIRDEMENSDEAIHIIKFQNMEKYGHYR